MAARSSPMDEWQVFCKDSFDRRDFGDDLCQLLLSYLSFEDQFRYECLSKQWQRFVYKRQTVLIINDNFIDSNITDHSFEVILKKCTNITTLVIVRHKSPLNSSVFDSIIQHCYQLSAIYVYLSIDISVVTIYKFFAKFVKRLQSIEWEFMAPEPDIRNAMFNSVKFAANVAKLQCSRLNPDLRLSYVLSGDRNEVLFQKLQNFRFKYRNSDATGVEVFVKYYRNSMKSIDVTISSLCTEHSIDILMSGLSRMRALIDLQVNCPVYHTSGHIVSQLRDIGANCRQLKRLSLGIAVNSNDVLSQLIDTINENFTQIKRLEFGGKYRSEFVINSDSLNQCKRLTHLNLCSFNSYNFGEEFVYNMAKTFPRLQYINMNVLEIKSFTLNSLALLRKLQYIELNGEHNFTATDLKCFVRNCGKIHAIYINKGLYDQNVVNIYNDLKHSFLQSIQPF